MAHGQTVQPPPVAAWLVGLFSTEEQTGAQEQIIENFSAAASSLGIGPARRWFWKQSAKTIADYICRGFQTGPWLIVGTAFAGALLLQLSTSSLQGQITAIIRALNHHVRPYYDSKGASNYFLWLRNAVLIGSLIESLLVGCLAAAVVKRREMITAMALSVVSLVMTATIFWVAVAMHAPVNPVLFPKIMIEQLSASSLIVVGGVIVREIRSSATDRLSAKRFA